MKEVPTTPESAVLFVMSTKVSRSAEAAYLSALGGIFGIMGEETGALKLVARGCRAGDDSSVRQARPASIEEVRKIVRGTKDARVAAAIALAWASASRIGDVVGLSKDNLLQVRNREEADGPRVIIGWRTVPKGRRLEPFVQSAFCVVTGSFAEYLARTLPSLLERGTLVPEGASHVVKGMKEIVPTLSGHSVKRGAVEVLLAVEPPVDSILLARVLKHASGADALPRTTIRYASELVTLALYLGTQKVTRFL